jgi:hypothetical protein
MDPFLESTGYFPDLHYSLITFAQQSLQTRLPSQYFAKKAQRVWLEHAQRCVEPDVFVARGAGRTVGDESGGIAVATLAETGAVAVAAEPDPVIEFREPYLEIYTDRGEKKRVVTSIEILSPTNKTSAGQGRGLYLQKQQELLMRDVHLMEIDLLRAGTHTSAVPHDALVEKVGHFDYHACLRCFHDPKRYYVWPIRLENRLPEILVPLLPDDPMIPLDLQAIFDRSYDAGPFQREIDYQNETPDPPLTPEQQAWVRQRLKIAG